jgi:L-asparaginase
LTGAQKPIDKEDTDARINLRDSFLYAASDKASDVVIVFQGKVIAGTRAKKIRTKSYNAFDSVDFPEIARIRDGKIFTYIPREKRQKPEFFLALNSKVGLINLTPGMHADILDAYFAHNDAVVLSGYGTGGIPEGEYYGFYDVIEKWQGKGKTIVVTTQVQSEGSDMNIYRVGRNFKKRFAILESYEMTYESILTKLMYILAKTQDEEKIRELFYAPVNYDLIY